VKRALKQADLTIRGRLCTHARLAGALSTSVSYASASARAFATVGAEVVSVNAKDALGRRGEDLAADYLKSAGLQIVDRNWRCGQGELDIVAVDRRTLVACEVKTRSGTGFGTPLEAIGWQKRRRLRHLAVLWILAHGLFYDEVRIDAVGVLRSPAGEVTIEHVRGVG
jgi:putative endonuclease